MDILDKLQHDVVLGDGGAIFELERRGYIAAGPFTPEVVIEHPHVVRQLHEDFARAGAEVIQALTYYGHAEKLRLRGLEHQVEELNARAVKLAREVADEYGCVVAGNLCNTWVYDPGNDETHAETRRQFDQQIASQLAGGCDFFIAETLEYLGEALIATEAIKARDVPAMVTMGFKYAEETLDGTVLEDAFRQLADAGADIVGINCFRDPLRTLPLARRVRQAVDAYLATQPVGYRCSEEKPYFQIQRYDGRIAFPLEMDPLLLSRRDLAEYAIEARQAGVNYIGGCCGVAPHHLRAMAEALGRTVPNTRYTPQLHQHAIIGDAAHRRERNVRIVAEQQGVDGEAI